MTVVRKKSKALDKFLKAAKHGRLLPAVERHMQTRPQDTSRRSDILHPSAMSHGDWCPRAAWFNVMGYPEPRERLSRRTLSVFDEGHHIHNKWQTWFHEMGVLYGTWRCLICKNRWWATSPEYCQDITCQSTLIKYAEVPLEYEPWIINGHADGWIKGIEHDALIELKSVGSGTVRMEAPAMFERYEGNVEEIWRNIKRPFPSHLKQALLYLEVLHASRDDAPAEVIFIYEAKFNQDAKEFIVPRNRSLVQPLIDGAQLVKHHKEIGTPPDCPFDGCAQCKPYNKEAA